MKTPVLLCLLTALLAGCASTPTAPGSQVPAARLAALVKPGQTTRAELLAAFGTTKSVVFDSGFEVWVYQSPAGNGQLSEFVILIDPAGIVIKTRQREAAAP